ncbi:MAG TPA: DciA family protein [Rhizomicrobium sp.]
MADDAKHKEPELPFASPPRRNWTEPVSRSAAPIGSDLFARAGFRDPTLVLRWAEIAGPEVARLCQPIRLSQGPSGGVLTLKAEPGASLFLQHETRELCDRINRYLGAETITRLKFVQGPLALRPKAPPRRRAPGQVPHNDPALAYQGPNALREALLKLARARAARRGPD